jgi:hypothetical protein
MRRLGTLLPAAIVAAALVAGLPVSRAAQDPKAKAPARPPAIAGAWTGTWGPYNTDPNAASSYTKLQAKLDCKVVALADGKWQATFEGECGRPYKYTIQMLGRTTGGAVLFQGSADLGEKDGGVYDWIGRATDKEFVGFYTSQTHVGHFRLTRAPAAQ